MKKREERFRKIFRAAGPIALVLTLFLFSAQEASTQPPLPIENGTVTTCDAFFLDDGGEGGTPYSPNNSYVFTICPDNPGDVIQVDFVAFNLYTSPNPANSDYLSVFDGEDTSAGSLGDYTGTSIQGNSITGSVNNPSGCLTFVFNPNPNGNTAGNFPGWAAIVSCTTPCDNPTMASAFENPLPEGPDAAVGICIGDEVTVVDDGSFAAAGFAIEEYVWRWGDGTETVAGDPGPVTHAYEEPGEYLINLTVIDNNGCNSLNVSPLQVLVSTLPEFNLDIESPVCIGNPFSLDGSAIQSVTWTALPPQVVAGETYLADGAGFQFTSSLVFDFFPIGAVLENCEDLLEVFVNIEHSYMGDLELEVACPDGTSVVLLEYPNGGGGTYLGEAVNDPFEPDGPIPGVGYTYGWAPGATNGNINNNENWTMTQFINNAGASDQSNIVNPGTYQADNDLCALEGCPLNGEWQFLVTDNLALDDGHIFFWGIDFNPELLPDVTTFTPVIGMGPDSTFWEGPGIVSSSDDNNIIDVVLNETGSYDYTFFATNNFGCTFDTTVTVEAVEGPAITAGPDVFVCDEPVTLQAGLDTEESPSCTGDGGTYEYCYENNDNLIVTFCPDEPGDGITFMGISISQGFVENFFDAMTIYDGDGIDSPVIEAGISGDLAGLSWTATNPSGCITFQITSDGSVSCGAGNYDPIIMSVSCLGGGNLIWSWSPEEGLSNPNVQNPDVFVTQATTYTVTAFPPDLPGCVITDQVTVAPDPDVDPGLDTDTVFCYNSPPSQLINYLQGTPSPGGDWVNLATGEPFPNQFTPTDHPNGVSFTLEYTLDNGFCQNSSILNLTVLGVTNDQCCFTNAVAGEDAIPCGLSYELQAFEPIGTGTWSGPDNVTFSNVNDPGATVTATAPGGAVTLTWTDTVDNLCQEEDQITVNFANPLEIILIPTDALCNGECSGSAIAIPSGGTPDAAGIYNYIWSSGEAGPTGQVAQELCAGEHRILVTDNLGCTDSVDFIISEPAAQQINTLTSPPLCADSCNGRVTVLSQGAVSYSYDGGVTWSESNVGDVCAGVHTIIARNENGCEIQTEISLNDPPRFEANFNINPNPTTIKNTTIQFQNVSTPGPIAETLFIFGENGNVGTSTDRLAYMKFPQDTSGTYPITLITTSENGCTDTLTRALVINDDLLWYIPNAFTPDQDGINELWKPQGSFVDLTNYRLEVYDRWGRRVFETTDFDQGWNGSIAGSTHFAENGIYNYIIRVRSITTEETYELNGFIMLIR